MKIEDFKIGIRTQDIQHGLRDVQASGPLIDLANTLLIGKAATLAMHLKGLNYIDDIRALKYMAGELGISSFEFDPVMNELQEIGFIRIIKSRHTTIKRIEISIPELRDGYSDLGERWKELSPTEIEEKAIHLVERVSTIPINVEKAKSEYDLDPSQFSIITDLGRSGTFLEIYKLEDGSEILYSPIMVDENPEKIYEFCKKYSENEVSKAISQIQRYQGMPKEKIKNPILMDAILSGVLLAPVVTSSAGPKRFIFTPISGLSTEEKVILDKARAILACVRYGQRYAIGTRIKWPKLLLQRLLENKRLGSHPELHNQYGLLVTKGLGKIEEVTRGFYSFIFYDTPENLKALRFAMQMLEIGESGTPVVDEETRQILIQSGSYRDPAYGRTKLSRELKRSKATHADVIKIISKVGRGVV